MNLILISTSEIIIKIFSLVCRKIDIDLKIKNDFHIKDHVDFIILDGDFVDDDFNTLKNLCSKLGVITNEDLAFSKARDFELSTPFLPTYLQKNLEKQIENIKEKQEIPLENYVEEEIIVDETEIITNYVESLASDIASDIECEDDESIVTISTANEGGILDDRELSKITDILNDDKIKNEVLPTTREWKDISSIIDEALVEVKDFNFESLEEKQSYKLILNDYNINELKPLFNKFDQKFIDRLSNGEEVELILCLKANYD